MLIFAIFFNLAAAAIFTALFVWDRWPVYAAFAVANGGLFLWAVIERGS